MWLDVFLFRFQNSLSFWYFDYNMQSEGSSLVRSVWACSAWVCTSSVRLTLFSYYWKRLVYFSFSSRAHKMWISVYYLSKMSLSCLYPLLLSFSLSSSLLPSFPFSHSFHLSFCVYWYIWYAQWLHSSWELGHVSSTF